MVQAGELRRIDRGLYDRPSLNNLTKRPTTPDYRAVTEAIARRDHLRLLVDGMTAANDLGLTDAVPARVTIHTDTRRRAIQLDKLTIEFKQTAPSRLYWAGRPAMRIVQALHWLKDTLTSERSLILNKLTKVLADPIHGAAPASICLKVSTCCRRGCKVCSVNSPDVTRRLRRPQHLNHPVVKSLRLRDTARSKMWRPLESSIPFSYHRQRCRAARLVS